MVLAHLSHRGAHSIGRPPSSFTQQPLKLIEAVCSNCLGQTTSASIVTATSIDVLGNRAVDEIETYVVCRIGCSSTDQYYQVCSNDDRRLTCLRNGQF